MPQPFKIYEEAKLASKVISFLTDTPIRSYRGGESEWIVDSDIEYAVALCCLGVSLLAYNSRLPDWWGDAYNDWGKYMQGCKDRRDYKGYFDVHKRADALPFCRSERQVGPEKDGDDYLRYLEDAVNKLDEFQGLKPYQPGMWAGTWARMCEKYNDFDNQTSESEYISSDVAVNEKGDPMDHMDWIWEGKGDY